MPRTLRLLSYSLLLSLTVSCTVPIPDTKVCAVSGILAGGAHCAHTLTDETEKMTLSEFISFLEPDIESGEGGALCVSVNDFAKLQIALEQACRKLGAKCSKESKEQVKKVSERISKLKIRKKVKGEI